MYNLKLVINFKILLSNIYSLELIEYKNEAEYNKKQVN